MDYIKAARCDRLVMDEFFAREERSTPLNHYWQISGLVEELAVAWRQVEQSPESPERLAHLKQIAVTMGALGVRALYDLDLVKNETGRKK